VRAGAVMVASCALAIVRMARPAAACVATSIRPPGMLRRTADVWLRRGVAASLNDKTALLHELGRGDEALSTCDDSLALLGQGTESELRELAVTVLLRKGDVLWHANRFEAAIVIYDGALAAYREARTAGGGATAVWAAIAAVFNKLSRLCALDRGEEARQARGQLGAILGDVCEPRLGEKRSGAQATSERELAATQCRRQDSNLRPSD
jgi:hypothetical protein